MFADGNKLPVTIGPVAVMFNTFATPALLTVTLALAFTTTLLLPLLILLAE